MSLFPRGNEATPYLSTDWDGTEEGVHNATWVAPDGLEAYDRESRTNRTDHYFYHRQNALSVIGIPARGITLRGRIALDDQGQNILRSYSPEGPNSSQNLGFMYLYDGSRGYAQMVQVGATPEGSEAQGGLHTASFELAPQSDPVPVSDFGS